ncbi:protein polyglycylase TTLL10 isoform X2 [Alosa sapidissima]|uniref:protein polyglycylase TTLL10 isoform X2 n=1 Tax=Alosa sapidissima TaxID=34773 RepID=UPI001C08ED26|nr:protein polyglycylase TTLL10 isoform X2 [Alosa sapidissima]
MSSESGAGPDRRSDALARAKEDGDHMGREDPPPLKSPEHQAKGGGNDESRGLVASSLDGDRAQGPGAKGKQQQEEEREAALPQEPLGSQPSGTDQPGEQVKQADGVRPDVCQNEKDSEGSDSGRPGQQRRSRLPYGSDRDSYKRPMEPLGPGPFFFIGGGNGAPIVAAYCENKGWQRIYDRTREDYKLKWCETRSMATYYNFKEGEQLLFQIPNNKVLTSKIGLLNSLREYDRVSSKVNCGRGLRSLKMDDFFPATFRMDVKDEREAFFAQQERACQETCGVWICKPTDSNQGRGIFLLRSPEDISAFRARLQTSAENQSSSKLSFRLPQAQIVQKYVQKPLLLQGRKFDVRSYLLIASTTPYMVFFRHGYVRLTCDLYDPNSKNLSAHLTNQYMQKKNPLYSELKEETVWSIERFNEYVNENFTATGLAKDWVHGAFTRRMQQIMLQCFMAVKAKLVRKLGFFDLIGCDFLIDEDFKVWLLEMNCNPALHTNCKVLKEVVPNIVTETLDLALEIFEKCRYRMKLQPLASQRDFVLLYRADEVPTPSQKSKGASVQLQAPKSSTVQGSTRPRPQRPAALDTSSGDKPASAGLASSLCPDMFASASPCTSSSSLTSTAPQEKPPAQALSAGARPSGILPATHAALIAGKPQPPRPQVRPPRPKPVPVRVELRLKTCTWQRPKAPSQDNAGPSAAAKHPQNSIMALSVPTLGNKRSSIPYPRKAISRDRRPSQDLKNMNLRLTKLPPGHSTWSEGLEVNKAEGTDSDSDRTGPGDKGKTSVKT